MTNDIQRILDDIIKLKAAYDLLDLQEAKTLNASLYMKAIELSNFIGKELNLTLMQPLIASRDANIAGYQTIHNVHVEDAYRRERIYEVYRMLETDPFNAIRKFDILMMIDELKSEEVEKFKNHIKNITSNKVKQQFLIRDIGRGLINNIISKEEVRNTLKRYNLDYLFNTIFFDDSNISDRSIVEFFERYDEFSRDYCVVLIIDQFIKIQDERNINQNYSIFADHRILSSRHDDPHTQSILSYLSQRSVVRLKRFVDNIESEFKNHMVQLLPERADNLDILFKELKMIGMPPLEELKFYRHLAITDDLIFLSSFADEVCNLQRSGQRKAWSVCISDDTMSSMRQDIFSIQSVLEDINRAIADAWLDLLADQPKAFFSIHPDIQKTLGHLFHWYIHSLGSLAMEFYERGSPSLIASYENLQQLFIIAYNSDSRAPSEQELLSWLKLRPDNCQQTWLWVIQKSPNPQYIAVLNQLLPYLEKANTWVRLVLSYQNVIPHKLYWVGETQKSLEERFEHFFRLLTGDTFASQFRGEKSDAEARQAFIHLFYRSQGSFKRAILIFLETYQATVHRVVNRKQGRFQLSDFAP